MDSLKVMNKFEYWFLDTVVERPLHFNDLLPHPTYGCLDINRAPLELSLTEMAKIMEGLFQRGDLLVIPPSEERFDLTQGFIPSRAQIEAALSERLNLFYFLTPQGGQRWESVSNPKWEQYFSWVEGYLTCASREMAEKILAIRHLLPYGNSRYHVIPETAMWETLTPWQATYWKTLPVGYQVNYQYYIVEKDEMQEQSQELLEQECEAEKYYFRICKWYTDYYRHPNRTIVNRVEYWLLDSVVQMDEVSFPEIAYRLRLSRADTIEVAHSLFKSGDIRAWVFADAEDLEGEDDVVLTLAEIETIFDRKLDAYYYLTEKGSAKWEAMVNPDWNRYFFHDANQESGEILSSDRDLIEEILSKDSLLHNWALVEGTEEWEILEPWEATYWKTLPRGYRVRYQTFDNRDYHERRHGNPELESAQFQAYRWYVEVGRWYTFPYLEY